MKKSIYASALAAGCSLLLAAGGFAAEQKMGEKEQQREQEKQGYTQQQREGQQQQARQEEQQKSEYARQLVTPDKLNGMKIQNRQGEEIGSVDKVVLDSQNGQIAYVVVTSGGFWGIGGEKAVIPWKAVELQQEQDKSVLMVDVSKEQLKNAPQGDIEQVVDRRQAEQIHQYYGVAPYWEGQQQQQLQQMQMEQRQQQKELQQQQQKEKQERMQ